MAAAAENATVTTTAVAAVGTGVSGVSGKDGINRDIFEHDDEETWKMLVSLTPSDADISPRLKGLASRLEEDFQFSSAMENKYWKETCQKLIPNGFRYSTSNVEAINLTAAPSTPNDGTGSSGVDAFQSDMGKKHLKATSALLGLPSETRAAQITLSALRSVDPQEENSQFQALLGSRDLLFKTLVHHSQQRFARLSIITECLRLEQDKEAVQRDVIVSFLDSIDSTFSEEGDAQTDPRRNRGLFRRLLTLACGPDPNPTRDNFEPSKALHTTKVQSLWDSVNAADTNTNWNAFCGSAVEELRALRMKERLEAMEALLLLLYERIDGGICRSDYALLLYAFQGQNFFTDYENQKLSKISSLICAEAMALWRILENMSNDGWVGTHPLLVGITSSSQPKEFQAKNELNALVNITKLLASARATSRSNNRTNTVQAPESLALLSFGLLLSLYNDGNLLTDGMPAQGEMPSLRLQKIGQEMTMSANDQFGAFDYLRTLVESFGREPSLSTGIFLRDHIYDWQYPPNARPEALEDGVFGQVEPSSSYSVAYMSISREILAASIAVFGGSVLSIEDSNACENIGVLCNLAAKIYRNNPMLCEQFWGHWEAHQSTKAVDQSAFPICRLLDAAYQLAVAALDALFGNRVSQSFLVTATAPFFRLLSSVSHVPNVVQRTIETLPAAMIRETLLSCRLKSTPSDQAYVASRTMFLEALSTLTRVGSSKTCLEMLRLSLENPSASGVVADGPRVLGRILSGSDLTSFSKPVLQIMANLLVDAPQRWALQFAREFVVSQGLAIFLSQGSPASHAATKVLGGLIGHLVVVMFCDSFGKADAIAFLDCVTSGILSAGATLASCLSAAAATFPETEAQSYERAQTILQIFTHFLKHIRAVIDLHGSEDVRKTALRSRDAVINALATITGLGQAVIYFATAPAALGALSKIQGAVEDNTLIEKFADEVKSNDKNAKNYGAWQSVLSKSAKPAGSVQLKHLLLDAVNEMTVDRLDLDSVQGRGWASDGTKTSLLSASSAAIRLLSVWASHVEAIVQTHSDGMEGADITLDGASRDLIKSLSPEKLLSSLATIPVPCRSNGELMAVWTSAGLSNFELLLPYLASRCGEIPVTASIPVPAVLDLIHTCLVQVRVMTSAETVSDSMMFRTIQRSSRFPKLLVEILNSALEDKRPNVMLNALLCLRVLRECVRTSPTVADCVLRLETESVVPRLIAGASKAMDVLGLITPKNVFDSHESIGDMRLATGCLSVLAALWSTAHTASTQYQILESVGTRLGKAVEDGIFIRTLVNTVTGYANDGSLESRIVPSAESESAKCSMMAYIAIGFDILSRELAYEHAKDGMISSSSLKDLVADFVPCQRLSTFEGYQSSFENRMLMLQSDVWKPKLKFEPERLLRSFPSTAASNLSSDFFTLENAFDVASAVDWLAEASYDQTGANVDDISAIITRISISQHLVACDISILTAWQNLAETLVLVSQTGAADGSGGDEQRVLQVALDTAKALKANVDFVERSQIELSGPFLKVEAYRMILTLSQLVLFFLDMAVKRGHESGKVAQAKVVELLDVLSETSESVFSIVMFRQAEGIMSTDLIQTCCSLEQPLLASIIVLLEVVEPEKLDSVGSANNALNQTFNLLCRVTSRILQMLSFDSDRELSRKRTKKPPSGKERCSKVLRCTVAIFRALIARGSGQKSTDTGHLKMLSDTLKEHNVLPLLFDRAIVSSNSVTSSLATRKAPAKLKSEEVHSLSLVKSILSLICTIAEVRHPAMLSIINIPGLSQVVVRNSLHSLGASARDDEKKSHPTASSGPRSFDQASSKPMFMNSNDPVHQTWMLSIRCLQSCLNASQFVGISTCDGTGTGNPFYSVVLEFLCVHRHRLLSALKQCGTKLTKYCLHEAKAVLSLIAEICKRNIRDTFLRSQRELCEEFVLWAKYVVVSVSKFLTASGTSRELFLAIDEYESSDSDAFPTPDQMLTGAMKPRHPLLADGLPSAKHEAVKYSHFASRCCVRVSKEDFDEASIVPPHLKRLSTNKEHESDLELNCRLAISSQFALNMETAAADCVASAITIIWRMHPSSFSFQMFDEMEIRRMDAMALVHPGLVIAFRPGPGDSMFAGDSRGAQSFEHLFFGRVLSCDTLTRTWQVQNLSKGQENPSAAQEQTSVIKVTQLAGIEDMSMRKAVTSFQPAPNNMADLERSSSYLSFGHLILVLRWCYQKSLSTQGQGQGTGMGFRVSPSVCRLAEQTVALLGAELVLHGEIGSHVNASTKDKSQMDTQLFELFADERVLDPTFNLQQNTDAATSGQEGKLKSIVSQSCWKAVQPQVRKEVERAWVKIQERKKSQREKRSWSNDSGWLPGVRRRGHGKKSAFRGLG